MSDYLASVIERKKREVEALDVSYTVSLSDRSLIDALRSKKPSLIAEVKPASPSVGQLIGRDRIPLVVDDYNTFAQAISVLCDEEDFGGGFDLLKEVRAMTELPILAKEFVIDERQILLSRASGADAVLLIAKALNEYQIAKLSTKIVQLGMTILFEVHDKEDCTLIPDLPPDQMVIGINNRDLRSLEVDLETTEKIAPHVRVKFANHILLSMSGIRNKKDAEQLMHAVDGFLIGTSLLESL